MKNVLIWGFDHDITREAVQQLENEKLISIKAWYQEPKTVKGNSKGIAQDWFQLVFHKMDKEDILYCDEKIYSYMYQHLYVFMDIISRAAFFQNKRIHEYLNVFNLFVYYFYGLIKKRDIQLMIFEDIPHGPANYVLYHLGKVLDIPTVMVCQSLFPDKFFYFYDVDDYGLFDQVPEYKANNNGISIEKEHQKDLFYMKKPSWQEKLVRKTKMLHSFSEWKEERKAILRKTSAKYEGIVDFVQQDISRKLIKKNLQKAYRRRAEICFSSDVDLNKDFVYFPLHLQPEMTTSALGGVYCDQLLAIEQLSQKIPADWYIYVKENPKQDFLMRGQYFFERLSLIPKVKTVKLDFNTYDLIKNCRFVATITGTAGWEAISGGTNSVVFGKAWYKCLPGVFQYSEDLDINQVLNYKIDHMELEKSVTALLKKMADGLVNADYLPMLPNFSSTDNKAKIVRFLKFILEENK